MTSKLALLLAAVITLSFGCGDDDRTTTRDAGPTVRDSDTPDPDAGSDPDGGSQCVDSDGDGYGAGCALGLDCDDANGAVSPAAMEVCNGVDDDCDDADDEDIAAPSCALTEGVCAGAVARCGGAAGFLACDATDYGAEYEADETMCDRMDNDCDGSTDEGCECVDGETQPCGSDVGACMVGTQTCVDSMWGACDGEVGPMGEVCDGEDNDCDASSDEPGDLTPPPCPLQLGVCAGSVRACGGAPGWIACSGVASYGGDYQAVEMLCDELDNDCDGVTDEGCMCVDGRTQSCGTDVGECQSGTQTCTAGSWGGCAGEVAAIDEACNGLDDDCDGTADDDLVAPACALTTGVCAGSTQRCSGAGGFVACTATEYGATYQATESRCDGVDNDCDGTIDEGCVCIDGSTQACGSSVGACERGTQTCAGGAWGPCTGGVLPSPELCNGDDDDCNGASDDALTPPPCMLTGGVCAGSVQTCGGAAGWIACAGTDSYGPRYRATEPGGTDEGVCDGLDNDCNGMIDDGCASGPLFATDRDEVLPDVFHQHVVYSVNFDGNWDVVFDNLTTGEQRRLTTTPEDELYAKVYGNYVVWSRASDSTAARAVLHNLVTGTTTVLSTRQSDHPTLSSGAVFFEDFDGTQWDPFFYEIATGMSASLLVPNTTNEFRPVARGGRMAFVSNDSGTFLVNVLDFATGTVTEQTPARMSVNGQGGPVIDYLAIGWLDGREITGTPMGLPTEDIDIYGASFGGITGVTAFPGENALATALSTQSVSDLDGLVFAWSDHSAGNWNTVIGDFGGELVLTTHPATQADPTVSGNVVLWEDNRLGNFDIYGSVFSGAAAPAAGLLLINEILADPMAGADPNGDGTASTTQDEFVEIVNASGTALDLSGMTLSDATGVRHTFAPGTVLPALGTIVVFGGGSVGATSLFGGARVVMASTGALGLNNDGDTLTLRSGTTAIDTVMYGTIAGNDESIVRSPEVGAASPFVRHSTMTGALGRFSPGNTVRGFGF